MIEVRPLMNGYRITVLGAEAVRLADHIGRTPGYRVEECSPERGVIKVRDNLYRGIAALRRVCDEWDGRGHRTV